MKRLPSLVCCVKRKHHVHYKPKGEVVYVFNSWYQYNFFCLKDFSVSAWSIIVIVQSQITVTNNVRKNVSGYGLGWTVFVLSKNYDVYFNS